jgi:hypothetical protein
MFNNFNFITLRPDGLNFNFGDTGSSPYNDFDFVTPGYIPIIYDFNFGEGHNVYNIIKSPSNNFIAIWADLDAGLETGKMYVSSASSFNIINLNSNSVEDYYTQSHAGEAGEVLEGNDIVDVNAL